MTEVDVVKEYRKLWELANELADKEVKVLPEVVVTRLVSKEEYVREKRGKLTAEEIGALPDMVAKVIMPKTQYKQDRLGHHLVAMIEMFVIQKEVEEVEIATRE